MTVGGFVNQLIKKFWPKTYITTMTKHKTSIYHRPRGLMDKASDFESEDCEFESRRGHYLYKTFVFWKPLNRYFIKH